MPNGASCRLEKVETASYADKTRTILLKDEGGDILITCRFDSDDEAKAELDRINDLIV